MNLALREKLQFTVEESTLIIPWILPPMLLFSRALADTSVVIIGLLFICKSFLDNDWLWLNRNWFRFSLFFWLYLLLINVPLSVDSQESLGSALAFIRWPIFASALSCWIFVSMAKKRILIQILLASSLFVFIDLVWQYFNGTDVFGIIRFTSTRLTGPFRSPLPGTLMLRVVFILPLACFVFECLKSSWNTVIYLCTVLALGSFMIFLTGERMAFMMVLAGSAIVIVGLLLSFPKQRIPVLFLILVLFFSSITVVHQFPKMEKRTFYSIFTKLEHFSESDYGLIFKDAIYVWEKAPVFGHGFSCYKQASEQIGWLRSMGINPTHPHNLYLQLASETGIIGVLLFCLMLFGVYRAAIEPMLKARQWYLASISFAILFVSFFPLIGGIRVFTNWIASLVWFGVGWCLTMARVTDDL